MMPESLDHMVALATAKLTLDRLSGEEIHAVAMRALLDGIDFEEVLVLVDSRKPFASDVEDLFTRMIHKLGVKLPSVQEATLRIAREVATRIVSGSMFPYEGARHIGWTLATIDGHDQRLDVFVALASEYEDATTKDHKVAYAQDIMREARALVDESNDLFGAT